MRPYSYIIVTFNSMTFDILRMANVQGHRCRKMDLYHGNFDIFIDEICTVLKVVNAWQSKLRMK